MSKLNEDKVRVIKDRLKKGESQTVIANDLDLNRSTIYKIAHGKTWSHVV